MRCFLALELPDGVRQKVSSVATEADRAGVRAAFVPKEQIHVTLAFFGELAENEVEEKKKILEAECAAAAPFGVRVRGIGFLPDAKKPRVLYAAVDSPELAALQNRLAAALHYDDGRPFHGHATIARLKSRTNSNVLRLLDLKFGDAVFGEFKAREIVLKKSTLGAEGAVHETIARFPLKAPV